MRRLVSRSAAALVAVAISAPVSGCKVARVSPSASDGVSVADSATRVAAPDADAAACTVVSGGRKRFVLASLPDAELQALARAVERGPACVRLTACGLHLMESCAVGGHYVRATVPRCENEGPDDCENGVSTLALEHEDEVAANLPPGTASVAAGAVFRWTPVQKLDLQRAVVLSQPAPDGGTREATNREGATHVVQRLELGSWKQRAPSAVSGPEDSSRLVPLFVELDPLEGERAERVDCGEYTTWQGNKCAASCPAHARAVCRERCDRKQPESCLRLSRTLRAEHAPGADREAWTLLVGACRDGSRDACREAASARATGSGAAQAPAESMAFSTRACELGDVTSCLTVAASPLTAPEAQFGALVRACERGTCTPLATRLGARPPLGAETIAQGVSAIVAACNRGGGGACVEVARFELVGRLLPRDRAHAIKLLHEQCTAINRLGCDVLVQEHEPVPPRIQN